MIKMSSRYNLRSRNINTTTTKIVPTVDSDVLEVATILYNLRSGNYSNAAPKYSVMNDNTVETKGDAEDWIDEKTDEEIIREACSCISRSLDPPERFFELLRMYDGGELSDDFVAWMNGIPPIRNCMENKSYRRSQATKQRNNRRRAEASARQHPLERTERRIGFSTNLVNTPPLDYSKGGHRLRKINTYNLRSLNAVTTMKATPTSTSASASAPVHRYNTRSTTSGTRTD